MNLKQNYLTQSGCYKAGKHITVKGLMIHSVGCPQPKADVFMKNWNRAEASACVHAIVEPDGDVYQLLPWDFRGWHCGGSANNTHIGVEMTEPATIKYAGGASWTETGNGENTKNHVLATYRYAVELFVYLCQQFGLDPMADGVIISHSEGCKRGIASNHGDVEHLWSEFGLSMRQFRKDIKAAMEGSTAEDSLTAIMGKAQATAGQMASYLKKKNPSVPQSVLDMIPLYLSEGEAEGVRGDIAFAQSCLETGNFTFSGSAVTLSQNNFCGLGVTQRGKKGLSFDTPQLGIRAQVQHLKAYASTDILVNERIDPRFRYVKRGCAPYVEWLGQKENPQGNSNLHFPVLDVQLCLYKDAVFFHRRDDDGINQVHDVVMPAFVGGRDVQTPVLCGGNCTDRKPFDILHPVLIGDEHFTDAVTDKLLHAALPLQIHIEKHIRIEQFHSRQFSSFRLYALWRFPYASLTASVFS